MPDDRIEVEVEQPLTPEVILFNDSRSLPQPVVALVSRQVKTMV